MRCALDLFLVIPLTLVASCQREEEVKPPKRVTQKTVDTACVKAIERAQTSLQRALESTALGYECRLRANIDIVNAQRDLFRTRRDLSPTRYEYFLPRLRLQVAVGQLTDENLDDINRMFTGH